MNQQCLLSCQGYAGLKSSAKAAAEGGVYKMAGPEGGEDPGRGTG